MTRVFAAWAIIVIYKLSIIDIKSYVNFTKLAFSTTKRCLLVSWNHNLASITTKMVQSALVTMKIVTIRNNFTIITPLEFKTSVFNIFTQVKSSFWFIFEWNVWNMWSLNSKIWSENVQRVKVKMIVSKSKSSIELNWEKF